MGYDVPEDLRAAERERLAQLETAFDRGTTRLLERAGVAPGWRCLEVGCGAGSIARWLARRVAPDGSVLATDVDTAFLEQMREPNLEVRRHDIVVDALPAASFDLAHARGVLQHVVERERALERMIAAVKPGGVVVIEEIDWVTFETGQVPEPLASVWRAMIRAHARGAGYDAYFGRRLLGLMRANGLLDVDVEGRVFTMRGGTPSAGWLAPAFERVRDTLVESGAVSAEQADGAIAQLRDPGFAVLSPISIAARGRRPPA